MVNAYFPPPLVELAREEDHHEIADIRQRRWDIR
jgi:hypothetical protein